LAGDDYGALPLHEVDFGAGKLTLEHLPDWLGDWWFGSTVGMIRARTCLLIK
jgi:hypothetical protein